MSVYHGEYLRGALDSYHELEDELIMLTGFNVSTLVNKLKAGYTIEPPVEENLTPHLVDISSMLGDYWDQDFRVYEMAPGVEWDDLTEYEQRKFLVSYSKFMNWGKSQYFKED